MATRIVRLYLRPKSKAEVYQSVKVVTNSRIPGRRNPVQLHLGYLRLGSDGGIPEWKRERLREALREKWLKHFPDNDVDIDWHSAERQLTELRDEQRKLQLERSARGDTVVSTGEDGRPASFCCGACEHVARAAARGVGYAPSPAIFVGDSRPGPVLVALLRGHRRDIALARGMRATIGRDRACDIWFDDEALSRRTCELRVTDAGAAFIEDLHSACGTVVNDARTAGPYRLHERDAIRIGSTLMVFQSAVQD